jgi:hypothetical protein
MPRKAHRFARRLTGVVARLAAGLVLAGAPACGRTELDPALSSRATSAPDAATPPPD